jgi:RsiW-degrading membrane proteinase PrsW (M82 family)
MPVAAAATALAASDAAVAAAPVAAEAPQKPPAPLGRLGLDMLALLLAVGGGLVGILGAFVQEAQALAGALLLVFIGAPVIEEALKPSGIYLLLVRWPSALRSQLHIAALCAVSGLTFGLVESVVYTELYYPDGSDSFVLYRFTVTPALHATASFIVGLGLSAATVHWAAGRTSLPKRTRNCFLAGAGLHAVYNTGSVVLGLLGVFDFLTE